MAIPSLIQQAREAWHLRWKRRRLLARAWVSGRRLVRIADRSASITPAQILLAATFRNEALRLPHFLAHYRKLGVDHFLLVDNASTDGTADLLRDQPDVSLWSAPGSYRAARFGLDWTNALLMRHAHGHWTLTVDADELLVYPHWETRDLHALTGWLHQTDQRAFGAMMLDLYPKGPLDDAAYRQGDDPTAVLNWFDAGNYSVTVQPRLDNLWIQGGVRARVFLADTPRLAPTLNKVPLVKWHWRYAYVNSTHSLLPRHLNRVYATDGGEVTSGLLLHTKFLPDIAAKVAEEMTRRQHFATPDAYRDYHERVAASPVLWNESSTALGGWRRLEALGLMSRGGWV
jgi:glycosyltransferase involved in cell wall biosynthesis